MASGLGLEDSKGLRGLEVLRPCVWDPGLGTSVVTGTLPVHLGSGGSFRVFGASSDTALGLCLGCLGLEVLSLDGGSNPISNFHLCLGTFIPSLPCLFFFDRF